MSDDLEAIRVRVFDPHWGMYLGIRTLMVHPGSRCEGSTCCIHNPSDHPLKDAPLQWRADRGLMERQCGHQQGHPDPDDLAHKRLRMTEEAYRMRAYDAHGCDGCCRRGESP